VKEAIEDRNRKMSGRLSKGCGVSYLAVLAAVLLLLGGCATPVGVRYLDPKQIQQNLTVSILSSDEFSAPTRQILNRSNLSARFRSEPEEVLAELHKGLPTASDADRLFALAELSYACASQNGRRSYYLASLIYAYAFLFPQGGYPGPPPSDPRVRIALDLYNRSLAEAFTTTDRTKVLVGGGSYSLPFGEMTIVINREEFRWGSFRFVDFVQAAELDVRGLRNRYRWPGIGAPLTAALEPVPGVMIPAYSRVPPGIKVPVTAFLRIENAEEGVRTGRVRGNLELYTTGRATTVTIDGHTVPIEYETSSALAYTLEGSRAYEVELRGLFSGNFSIIKDKARYQDGIFLMDPYRPGRMPVVFVHGTASSPARWAEMFNELQNDQELWGHYQFWVFTYNTGNPIVYSAGILAEGLRKTVDELDPEGKDPALRKMVVVGHSQGGLLAKLTAVNSGDAFWDASTLGPFEELRASPENKESLRRSVFFTPVPSVKRVIFLATPHEGSYVAGSWIGRLTSKFISLPFLMVNTLKEVITLNPKIAALNSLQDIPKSTDNMDPKSSFIKRLASMVLAPDVIAHSIIAVKNPEDPKEKWADGVVKYGSAHIDGVASELVVHSGHSTQDHPQTIEEVRRILLQHVRETAD
jgi:triacylglycerol esterase/lipase EstA (alpha/beta hydrolase family)